MERERMLELGLDPSKTVNLYLDTDGWSAEQFPIDADRHKARPFEKRPWT